MHNRSNCITIRQRQLHTVRQPNSGGIRKLRQQELTPIATTIFQEIEKTNRNTNITAIKTHINQTNV